LPEQLGGELDENASWWLRIIAVLAEFKFMGFTALIVTRGVDHRYEFVIPKYLLPAR